MERTHTFRMSEDVHTALKDIVNNPIDTGKSTFGFQRFTMEMSEEHAEIVHGLINSNIEAYKNWIVSALEAGNIERATELTAQLRIRQGLYAAFNMLAKREIASWSGKPVETDHTIHPR